MADRLTIEHYIGEAFVKCCQVILGARILPSGSTQQQSRPARDKRAGRWFLLELEETDGVGKEVELWRKDLSSPLVIEIQMAPGKSAALAAAASAAAAAEGGTTVPAGVAMPGTGAAGLPGELLPTLLERWTLQYERNPPPGSSSSMSAAGGGGGGSNSSSGSRTYLDEVSVYKRLIILVRSLYSYTRVLPAYKLFRTAKRQAGEQVQFLLQYRIDRSLQLQAAGSAAVHSAPRLQDFAFAAVDTPGGRFRVAVQFNPAAAALVLEHNTAPMAMPYTLNENYLGPGGGGGGAAVATVTGPFHGPTGRSLVGYAVPGSSAPAAAGMAARNMRQVMSSSLYGTVQQGRSPPADSGAMRQVPSAGNVGVGGMVPGSAAAAAATAAAPQRVITRQSWSSKEMKVSFSLPPPLGSPGGVGGAAATFRRSSSGYGSTPSTPPLPSPVNSGRPEGTGGCPGGAPPAAVVGSYTHHRPLGYQQHHHMQQQHTHPAHLTCHRCGSGGAAAGGSQLSSTPPRPSGSIGVTRDSYASGRSATAAAAASSEGASGLISIFTAPLCQQEATPTGNDIHILEGGASAAQTAVGVWAGAQTQHRGGGAWTVAAESGIDTDGSSVAASSGGGATATMATGDSSLAVGLVAPDAADDADAAGDAAQCRDDGVAAAALPSELSGAGSGSGTTSRTTSAPLAIPARSSSRTRSVADLRAPAVYGGFEVHPAVAAAAASSRTAASAVAAAAAAGLLGSQDGYTDPGAVAGAAAAAAAAAAVTSHHRMAPGSAPAAPRGMLGLALGALKPGTSGSGLGGVGTAAAAVASSSVHSDAAGMSASKTDISAVSGEKSGGAGATEAGGDGGGGGGGVSNGGATAGFALAAQMASNGSMAVAAASLAAASPSAVGASPAGKASPSTFIDPGSTAGSQALAVVRPLNNHHHHHHHINNNNHHRNASMTYGGIPGSSPPGGRPFPVPAGSMPPFGSPQLPFAFTPSVQSMSLASLHQALVPLGYFGHVSGAPYGGAPRAVSGRDITCLAIIRRPSWSSRSGSLDPSLASAGAAGLLLPSLSPLHDLLESSSSNASTPGAPHTRLDSADHTRRPAQRCRNPSSSSTSAIFSLSPSSAVPGTSPPCHLQHQQRRAAMVAKPTVTAAAERGGEGSAGGAVDGAKHVDKAASGHDHCKVGAAKSSSGGGRGGGELGMTRFTGEGDGGIRCDGSNWKGDAAGGTDDLTPQLGGEPAEDASQYGIYGPYCDPDVDPGMFPLAREDSESDLLPFALDQDGLVLSPAGGVPGAHLGSAAVLTAARADPTRRPGHPAVGPIELTLSIAQARERDVAVGAFVRMMVDAAPLAAPHGHLAVRELAPHHALAELEQLGAKVRLALEVISPELVAAAAAQQQLEEALQGPPPAPPLHRSPAWGPVGLNDLTSGVPPNKLPQQLRYQEQAPLPRTAPLPSTVSGLYF